jgi:hypothetical protein
MEGWKDGRMEGWKDGRMEGWKDGRMEGWKDGRMEGWKDGILPSFGRAAEGLPTSGRDERRRCVRSWCGRSKVSVICGDEDARNHTRGQGAEAAVLSKSKASM